MPSSKKSSSGSMLFLVLVIAAFAAYLLFFRAKSEPTEAAAVPAPPVVAPPAPDDTPAPAPPAPAAPAAPAPKAPDAPPPPAAAPTQAGADVAALIAEKKWHPARAAIAAVFTGNITDAARADLAQKGMEINQQLLVKEPDPQDVDLYEIQQGDSLEGIAIKHTALHGVKGSVMLLNNYTEKTVLRPGRKIRVSKGTWSVVVDKSLFQLYLCCDGAPFKAYRVAVGPEPKTPAATYIVDIRTPKPTWWPPADTGIKGPIKYGDPQNPLGEWWVGLAHELHHGLGIHGTNEPASIGTATSNGCIRMLNEEVVEAAAVTYKGMVVTIVE